MINNNLSFYNGIGTFPDQQFNQLKNNGIGKNYLNNTPKEINVLTTLATTKKQRWELFSITWFHFPTNNNETVDFSLFL